MINKKNAKKVLAHLERQRKNETAARFNMSYWGSSISEFGDVSDILEVPVCKTQACMAGETVLALGKATIKPDGGLLLPGLGSIPYVAAGLLNLNADERFRLFYFKGWGYSEGWPEKYETAYRSAKTPRARLTVAINRLKHFIKTDGAE